MLTVVVGNTFHYFLSDNFHFRFTQKEEKEGQREEDAC